MKKSTKIWLIIAAALTFLGLQISVLALAISDFDFNILSQHKTKTTTFEIEDDFENISITADTSDIVFLPSENNKTKVVITEREDFTPSASVKDSTLTIRSKGDLKWYQHISMFDFNQKKITVYLPLSTYNSLTINNSTGDVDISGSFSFKSINIELSTGNVKCSAQAETVTVKSSTGDISVSNIHTDSLSLTASTGCITVSDVTVNQSIKTSVSTGKVTLSNVKCKALSSTGDTGDIKLKNVIVSEKLSINRSTGDVTLERCDASEIKIVTDTGDVSGTLLSEKVFFARSDTGDIRVPQTMSGGRCEITTDTGDIKITLTK